MWLNAMKIKVFVGLLLFSLTVFAEKLDVVDHSEVQKYGKLVIENLLKRNHSITGDGGLYYPEACGALCALRFAKTTEDEELIEKLVHRYSGFLEKGNRLMNDMEHVDHNMRGIVPLQIYLVTGDKRYLKVGLDHADRQWTKEVEGGLTFQTRWWIDDMYMVGSLQMQAYRATGDVEYADKAARQIHAYIDRLQQPNGLFFHGPKYKFYWGRGNGWVAGAMAEILKDLPEDNPHRAVIITSYKMMMESLLMYQSNNGMWRQLLDNKYSWTESSCTAMFAYAMAVGVKEDILDTDKYIPAIGEAWKALCWQTNRDGNIRDVCIGTGQQDDVEFYLNRPRQTGDLHGQAPFIWLASELISN